MAAVQPAGPDPMMTTFSTPASCMCAPSRWAPDATPSDRPRVPPRTATVGEWFTSAVNHRRLSRPPRDGPDRRDLGRRLGRERAPGPVEERDGLGPREERAVGATRPDESAAEPEETGAELARIGERPRLLDR